MCTVKLLCQPVPLDSVDRVMIIFAGARGGEPAAVQVCAGDGDGGEGEPGAEADAQVPAGRAGQGRQEGAAAVSGVGAERAELGRGWTLHLPLVAQQDSTKRSQPHFRVPSYLTNPL